MAHNSSCANAATRVCRCAGCGGSLHGWPGYMAAVNELPAQKRLSESAEQAWSWASRRGARGGPTLSKARAAALGACAGIVSWVGSQVAAPGPAPVFASVEEVAEEIGLMLAEVATDLGGDRTRRRALADHFFCGLLAELADVIQRGVNALDGAIDEVVHAIMSERSAEKRSFLEQVTARLAVQAVAAGIKQVVSRLALVGHVDQLQRAVRILAILMCPAPERHKAVVEYCIDPLEQPIVSEAIRERLETSMPRWMTVGPVHEVASGF